MVKKTYLHKQQKIHHSCASQTQSNDTA